VISSVLKQVEEVCLYDNASNNIDEIENLMETYVDSKITLLTGDENRGIAYALNQIFDFAKEFGYSWILTLDHDTICPANMTYEYKKAITIDRVAILCPQVVDKEIANNKWASKSGKKYEIIDRCIQSGCLINYNVWKSIGQFDEMLFIDYVDFDFCKRVVINKYKVVRCNTVTVDHELGYRLPTFFSNSMMSIFKLSRLKLFKLLSYKNVYPSTRIYYMVRNNIIYIKKYRNYVNVHIEILKLLIEILKRIVRGKNRIMIIDKVLKGIRDGYRLNIQTYTENAK